MKSLSHVRLLATPRTAAYQAPLSMDSPGKNTGVGCHLDSIVLYNFLKFHVHDFMQSHDGGLVAKSCLALATPWTIACQAPLSMGFSRLEYWSGLPFPSPEDLPDPGIEPGLLHCKQILYQLSYEGSPQFHNNFFFFILQLSDFFGFFAFSSLFLGIWYHLAIFLAPIVKF